MPELAGASVPSQRRGAAHQPHRSWRRACQQLARARLLLWLILHTSGTPPSTWCPQSGGCHYGRLAETTTIATWAEGGCGQATRWEPLPASHHELAGLYAHCMPVCHLHLLTTPVSSVRPAEAPTPACNRAGVLHVPTAQCSRDGPGPLRASLAWCRQEFLAFFSFFFDLFFSSFFFFFL
jgi:hypothetical protein